MEELLKKAELQDFGQGCFATFAPAKEPRGAYTSDFIVGLVFKTKEDAMALVRWMENR